MEKVVTKVTSTVISKDGTPIAFDRYGEGPTVILVPGALGVRTHPFLSGFAGLPELLAPHFTVVNYDRRGAGDSGDKLPYAVEREVEDIEALIDEVGGPAYLYGLSSGGALALEAANRLTGKVAKLVMYEPPFIVDGEDPTIPEDGVEQVNRMVAEGRKGDALAYFIMITGAPEEAIPQIKEMPMWADMEKVAHTLAYDFTVLREKPLRPNQWPGATMPALAMAGGESDPFFHRTVQSLADTLPNAQGRILEGQTHEVTSEAIAPVLVEFFKD
jgi:pimeloyl-ACP methyl ester carboxylesterase